MTTRPDVRVDALTGELCRRKLRLKASDGTYEDTSSRVGAFCWALQDQTGATVLARAATFAVEDDIPTLTFAFDGDDNTALLTGRGESEDYRHSIVELVTGGQRIHLGGVYAVRRGLDPGDLPGTATDGGGPSEVWDLSGDPELLVLTQQGGRGLTGKSAYELAVENGFSGDETAWLATLGGIVPWDEPQAWLTATAYVATAPRSVVTINGSSYVCAVPHTSGVFATDLAAGKWLVIAEKGGAGDSAYAVAVAEGFVGDEAAWLASLAGATGASAYAVAVAEGFVGDEAAWLASLDGADGADGTSAVHLLTYGATITPDLAAYKDFELTLTGSPTIANPANATSGMTFVLELIQDGTGGRTVTWGSAYKFPGGIAPVLSVAAGAVDMLFCTVRRDGRVVVGYDRNYA